MLYEGGWKKNHSYIIAFSCEEVVDVTKRYTKQWTKVLSRRTVRAHLSCLLPRVSCSRCFHMLGMLGRVAVASHQQSEQHEKEPLVCCASRRAA